MPLCCLAPFVCSIDTLRRKTTRPKQQYISSRSHPQKALSLINSQSKANIADNARLKPEIQIPG